ncbi:DEAD/DEAH box helicase family protein [Brevundimonas sp.]|uniref:DEAD/DEAH box helicase family protein n=1 Tax=Brevundimonas sp. TaxID=1871086 RepID=UPI00289DF9F2|nr:DEAD/DEAH box helicase family protein [Brevundimonas sp.]
MKTFEYVDAPAGSGKTYGLTHYAAKQAQQQRKIIIAQPTKELIKQTKRDITKIDSSIKVTSIHGGRGVKNVVGAITRHLADASPLTGEVLLITHESLFRLESQGFRSAWQLVVDEIPDVFKHEPLKIKYNHGLVTPYLTTTSLGRGISAVGAADKGIIEDLIAKAEEDEPLALFRDVLKSIIDGNRLVCVTDEGWDELLAGDARQCDFFVVQKPEAYEGWNGVTMMGANAHFTEMMTIWPQLFDVEFKRHDELSDKLRYDKHDNGSRLTLHYMFDGWSKTYANLTIGDQAVITRVADTVEALFDGSHFIWGANQENEDLFSRFDFLPHKPHGINSASFQSCHNVALLSATNRETPAIKFLQLLGLDQAAIDATLAHQSAYQAAMRCSLRDPQAIAPVNIVVPTKATADWISARFAGSRVQHLETGLDGPQKTGRPSGPTSPKTPEEKRAYQRRVQAEYRARKKASK